MIPMRASVKLQAKLWLNPIMFHALGALIAANDALSFSARGFFAAWRRVQKGTPPCLQTSDGLQG